MRIDRHGLFPPTTFRQRLQGHQQIFEGGRYYSYRGTA